MVERETELFIELDLCHESPLSHTGLRHTPTENRIMTLTLPHKII